MKLLWSDVVKGRDKMLSSGFDVLTELIESKNCQEIKMEPIKGEEKWTGILASCEWHKSYRKEVRVVWTNEEEEPDMNILRSLAVWMLAISDASYLAPDFAKIEVNLYETKKNELSSTAVNIFK